MLWKSMFTFLLVIVLFIFVPKDKVHGFYYYKCDNGEEWVIRKKEEARKDREAQEKAREARKNAPMSPNPLSPNKDGLIELDLDSVPDDILSDIEIEIRRFETIKVNKSGLRKEIEGRLAWLGFDFKLTLFNKNC